MKVLSNTNLGLFIMFRTHPERSLFNAKLGENFN